MNGSSMCDSFFENTFQNKEHYLFILKRYAKNTEKCYFFLLYFHFSFKLANYPFIYLFVLQLTSQKTVYSACRKMFFLSSFLNSFIFLSNSQKMQIYLFVYFELSQVFSF